MSIVICRTDGCSSDGIEVAYDLNFRDQDTGETRTVDAVMCGACGQAITDIATDPTA